MLLALVDVVLLSPFNWIRSFVLFISIGIKKAHFIVGFFYYSINIDYALLALCFFAFGSTPNGLFLAKSTNTGAATKIEE